MKKVLVVIAVVLGAVLAVAIVGALVVSCRLESIVEAAIEEQGTRALGEPVSVGAVDLSIYSGRGGLEDLTVANPEGFDTPHVVEVGGVDVHLDPWSVLAAEGPIDVHDVEVRDMTVTVEAHVLPLETNLGALEGNLRAAREARDDGEPEGRDVASSRTLRIERIAMNRTKVQVVFRGPRRRVERSVTLADFELRDLGGRDGATPEEVASEIFRALAGRAKSAMLRAPGPWQELRNRLFENLDGNRLEKAGRKLRDLREALREGKSLRDVREAWREEGDGGTARDGGARSDPVKLREQLKTLRQTLREQREGRAGPRGLGRERIDPEPPALR